MTRPGASNPALRTTATRQLSIRIQILEAAVPIVDMLHANMTSTTSSGGSSPLVQESNHHSPHDHSEDIFHIPHHEPDVKTRRIVWGLLSLVFLAALVVLLCFQHLLWDSFYPWLGLLPRNTTLATLAILENAPVIVRTAVPRNYKWMITFFNRTAISVRCPRVRLL